MFTQWQGAHDPYSSLPMDDQSEFPTAANEENENDQYTKTILKRFLDRLKNIFSCLPKFSRTVVDVIVSVIVLLIVISGCISIGLYALLFHKPAPVIDKSYNSFKIPYHLASQNYLAYTTAAKNNMTFRFADLNLTSIVAKDSRQPNSMDLTRVGRSAIEKEFLEIRELNELPDVSRTRRKRFLGLQYQVTWKMEIVYLSKSPDKNIFTQNQLQKIHDIEKRVISYERFPDFCFKDDGLNDPALDLLNNCAPINSLLTYFYPSTDKKGHIYYDGLGDNIVDIDSALSLAMSSENFYYYVDDQADAMNRKSSFLRSEVLFGSPLKDFMGTTDRKDLQTERYKNFIVTYLDFLSKASTEDLDVLYGGKEIFDYEVDRMFWSDMRLAIYGLVCIFLLMLVLSMSPWLTIMGMLSILLSFPIAIFFYRIVFNIIGLGILNGVAAFLIIGIGVDDVFVFINIFRQMSNITDPRQRLWHTVKTAGKATFFTSFTTAAAFTANIASMIPAVHDFGLFMSLIVSCCWVTVMLMMPPTLYIWYVGFGRLEEKLMSRIKCRCKRFKLSLPPYVAQFIQNSNHGNTMAVHEDDDVAMLSLDNPVPVSANITYDDDPLELPNDIPNDEDSSEAFVNYTTNREERFCNLGSLMQAVLYHYLAVPVIKVRWIILGISLIILGVSISLVTQLHPSTKPPQFFRENTNIQRLLNLKANYSLIDVTKCYHCSGSYIQNEPASVPWLNIPTAKGPTWTAVMSSSSRVGANVTDPPVHFPNPKPTTKSTPQNRRPTPSNSEQVTKKANQVPPGTFKPIMPLRPSSPAHQPPPPTPESVPTHFNICQHQNCGQPKERPLLESGATVYVVFGIKGYHQEDDVGHVIDEEKGSVEFDLRFVSFLHDSNSDSDNSSRMKMIRQLCSLCKLISQNQELVRNGTAECFPSYIKRKYSNIGAELNKIQECVGLLGPTKYIYGQAPQAQAKGGISQNGQDVLWLAFAFESTTSKGQSYFEAYKEYLKWELFIKHLKETEIAADSPLQTVFQTSEFWTKILMEVVAVSSAIYGLVLSLLICMVTVAIFTGHIMLLLIVFLSICEMVCLVVGIFYIAGWEIGGVEAVSLSILVGSSVDYCVHLVEGYNLAADACPSSVKESPMKCRHWRTTAAISHIGVSILSSALTTIIAAIPLTFTAIQPFAKFGQILAINTTVCIFFSLTVSPALLSTIGPAYFKQTWKSTLKAFIGTVILTGCFVLTLFIVSKTGTVIPGPNGEALFS
ncbi:hypothetical protein CHS0354_041654 [Potamilus streckersoni]|uniref:SSD domain-containing protein n=1 Tax=Potamilus streckersoni TaxID=2493646 RepID=A0AAE0VUK0_9BIVA|nr:hypothetical protein CHS0354_041654 [Potamilus streckersoni]